MSILTMRIDPDPILHTPAKAIQVYDTSLQKLVRDMFETLHLRGGVGLAAPQVGRSIRLLVVHSLPNIANKNPGFRLALCNPEIVELSDEIMIADERCLSVPGWVGKVPRHAWAIVKGRIPEGKETRVKAEGYFARVLQHEIDHLNGILYTERVIDLASLQRVKPHVLDSSLASIRRNK